MPRPYIPILIRRLVIDRANGYCEYCYVSTDFSPDTFLLDHIEPFSLGGLSEPNNLALTCGGCNDHKYNKTQAIAPLSQQNVSLFHTRKDYWPEHFQWNEDKTLIFGITPIGRATSELLKVNRSSNINLRKVLLLAGLHPPALYPKD